MITENDKRLGKRIQKLREQAGLKLKSVDRLTAHLNYRRTA